MEDTFRFQKESETVTKTFYYKLEKDIYKIYKEETK